MRLIATTLTTIITILILIGDVTIAFFVFLFALLKDLWAKVQHFPLQKYLHILNKAIQDYGKRICVFINLFIKKIFLVKLPRVTLPQLKLPKKRTKRKRIYPAYLPIKSKLKYFAIGAVFACLFVGIPLGIVVIIHDLPNPSLLSQEQIPQTTKIYDRHHTLLYQFYANQNRTIVKLADTPLMLREATIAIEDKNFYNNPGFDLVAIARATIADVKGHSLQGGSTITQQLIKTSLLTSDRNIQRKIEEVILSFWAEHLYSKNQILEMYLNQVAYGGTSYGIQAASQTYFGKNVANLDLAQSAFLAGMPQAPSLYSPYGENPTLWKARQKDVLSRMQMLGYITKKQQQDATAEALTFQTPQTPILAPHFVMYIRDVLTQKYGEALVEKGGLSVTTTLDLYLQDMAQKVVTDEVGKDGYLNLTNGATLITNPQNGDILAMVGSHDYHDPNGGTVNVTTALRQPGSSIKIVTYAAALSHGYTAATIINDSPVSYPLTNGTTYAPVNYDGHWHGNVTLRTALANSLNIPAVKTLDSVGIPTFVNLGRQMGISSLEDPSAYGLSVTLGSADVTMLDMATAYGTVANAGKRVTLNPILLVTDAKGDILEQKGYPDGQQVLDAGVSFILSNILADNNARAMEFGPNSPLAIPGKTVSVKTGTTDNKRDNWTIGFNPPNSSSPYVVTVWVGNNDNSPMSQALASGITGAAPIWHDIMANLLQKQKDTQLTAPSNIVTRSCGGKAEYFLQGTDKNIFCNFAENASTTPQPSPTPQIVSQESHFRIRNR